jgi:hypothetical protein
MISHKDK